MDILSPGQLLVTVPGAAFPLLEKLVAKRYDQSIINHPTSIIP